MNLTDTHTVMLVSGLETDNERRTSSLQWVHQPLPKQPKRNTQAGRVLADLKRGATVSKLTSVHNGIGNVHDVIMRLRRMGWPVETVFGTDHHGNVYSKYELAA